MKISDFELELKKIDNDLYIQPHPKIEALAGVYYQGQYLFTIPNHNIFNDPNQSYAIEMPNGKMHRHRTVGEALTMAKATVYRMKQDTDYRDAMLGTGEYSDQKLGINNFTPSARQIQEENQQNSGIILP